MESVNMKNSFAGRLHHIYFAILFTHILFIHSFAVFAQDDSVWNGKKCAVVLTYDDALNVDLDHAIPLLDSLGFKATFYVPGFFPGLRARTNEWAIVGQHGHELGNHTLFHPCEGKAQGRDWVAPTYDLNGYTLQRIDDEMAMANTLLHVLDGRPERTFAYTCGDMKAGDTSFVEKVKRRFIAARGVEGKMQKLQDVDLYNIGSFMISGQTGDQLVAFVQQAMNTHSLIVFLFHGVGGEHALNVSLEAHHALLAFLKHHEKEIWIAPMISVARYIQEHQKK
jgi:peptidoglycan-N-acetylglucosamine deacetylase